MNVCILCVFVYECIISDTGMGHDFYFSLAAGYVEGNGRQNNKFSNIPQCTSIVLHVHIDERS